MVFFYLTDLYVKVIISLLLLNFIYILIIRFLI